MSFGILATLGKTPNGSCPNERFHPTLVFADVISAALENAIEVEFEIQIGVQGAGVSVDSHRGLLFTGRIRKIPGAQPVEPT